MPPFPPAPPVGLGLEALAPPPGAIGGLAGGGLAGALRGAVMGAVPAMAKGAAPLAKGGAAALLRAKAPPALPELSSTWNGSN
eukprot:9454739-Karenia_brevis.AAC.1